MARSFGVLLATTFGIAAIGIAAPARADESSYLYQMRQPNHIFDMTLTDKQLLRLGYAVCNGLASGQKKSQTHDTVAYTAVGMGLSPNMGTVGSIVNEAVSNLC